VTDWCKWPGQARAGGVDTRLQLQTPEFARRRACAAVVRFASAAHTNEMEPMRLACVDAKNWALPGIGGKTPGILAKRLMIRSHTKACRRRLHISSLSHAVSASDSRPPRTRSLRVESRHSIQKVQWPCTRSEHSPR
jgi:hypothetical protein